MHDIGYVIGFYGPIILVVYLLWRKFSKKK